MCLSRISPEERKTLDLSTWSLAFNGAEPIRPDTIAEFTRTFAECGFHPAAFYPCYGLAEATLMVTGGLKTAPPVVRTFDAKALENNQAVDALPDEEGSRTLVGCGKAFADQEVLIVDPETMTRCPDGRVGEIWVAGPSVAQGYWRHAEETAKTFLAYLKDSGRGPYLRTGDLGFLNDGELFVTGRLKDLIIIRGRNSLPARYRANRREGASAVASFVQRGVYDRGRRPRAIGGGRRNRTGTQPLAAGVRRSLRHHSQIRLRGTRNSDGRNCAYQGGQHSQNVQRKNSTPCLPQRFLTRQRLGNRFAMAQLGSRCHGAGFREQPG